MLLTPTETIFLWLARLNPLAKPLIDINYIKSRSYSRNNNLNYKVNISTR